MEKLKCTVFVGLTLILLSACSAKEEKEKTVESITVQNGEVYYYLNELESPFNVIFISDTHFTIEDERGKDFHDYSKRMGGQAVEPENYGTGNGCDAGLSASLNKAKAASARLVILGGDIINFPSLASVEHIRAMMDTCGMAWVYTAGNHDWHYEGEPGDSYSQREKWTATNLAPLYQGENPMYSSRVINGINFVTIDNSIIEITDKQLGFFEEQIKKGLPVVLAVHVPLYLQGHNIDYCCGSPVWNADHDIYYEIERREPWPEEGTSATTYKFRDLAINHPAVIGIFAGHTHEEGIDYINDRIQYVSDANLKGKDILIHFVKAE